MKQLAITIGGVDITEPTNFKFGNADLGAIINAAVPFILAFAGIGLLLMIISSGFALMTSAGDAKKMQAGKQRLTNALVGFLIIFGAYWITQAAGVIFGWQRGTGGIPDIFQ